MGRGLISLPLSHTRNNTTCWCLRADRRGNTKWIERERREKGEKVLDAAEDQRKGHGDKIWSATPRFVPIPLPSTTVRVEGTVVEWRMKDV